MRRGVHRCRRERIVIVGVLMLVAVAAGFTASSNGKSAPVSPPVSLHSSARVMVKADGMEVPASFTGFSFEYWGLAHWEGVDRGPVDPVLVQLVRNLGAYGGGAPVLRVGGVTTDASWWNPRGRAGRRGLTYSITPHWLAQTGALLRETGSQAILGLNLAANDPRLAVALERAALRALPARRVSAFEIGNEPDNYGRLAWYGHPPGLAARGARFARSRDYRFARFVNEFSRFARILHRHAKSAALVGPAWATRRWLGALPRFLRRESGRLRMVTLHRYALRACHLRPGAAETATIDHLLANRSSHGLARILAPSVSQARRAHLGVRVDELNSVACGGRSGVGNSFASALWSVDAMFELAHVGVRGVNVHGRQRTFYSPFSFDRPRGVWTGHVKPIYYGMLLFARATANRARLLPVRVKTPINLKVWATRDPEGTVRVVLLNKDRFAATPVRLDLGAGRGMATVERLLAPSAAATRGTTFAGQSYGLASTDGRLRGPRETEAVTPRGATYTVPMPPASAALITLRSGAGH